MNIDPDTSRTITSVVFVACVATAIVLAATGCREFAPYVVIAIIAVQALFIGATQD
jgi:hypothetical protein